MPAPDIKSQLEEAIALAQAGQRSEARAQLRRIVDADPQQEIAWLWLATVSADMEERIGYLERVLELSPHNRTAQQAYSQLTGEPYTPPAAAEQPAPQWMQTLRQETPLSPGNIFVIVMVALVGIVAILIVANLRDKGESDKDKTQTPRPTLDFYANQPRTVPTPTERPTRIVNPTQTPEPYPTFDFAEYVTAPPAWTTTPSPTPTITYTPSKTLTITLSPTPSDTPIPQPNIETRTARQTQTAEVVNQATGTFEAQQTATTGAALSQSATASFAQTSDGAAVSTPEPPEDTLAPPTRTPSPAATETPSPGGTPT